MFSHCHRWKRIDKHFEVCLDLWQIPLGSQEVRDTSSSHSGKLSLFFRNRIFKLMAIHCIANLTIFPLHHSEIR